MRPRPGLRALSVAADQVRGDREPLEVFGRERRFAISVAELRVGIAPRLPLEHRTRLIERAVRGHGARHRMSLRVSRTLRVTIRHAGTQSLMP